MANTVYEQEKYNYKENPLLFGRSLNIQRSDDPRYPQFEKANAKMIGFFWRPEEVSLAKDRSDFLRCSVAEKRIFTLNLSYQTLLDSVQGRSPALLFMPFVSNPEFEQTLTFWQMFEAIHYRSYSYIIKNLYPNPDEIFDNVLVDEFIRARAASVTQAMDDFLHEGLLYRHAVLLNPSMEVPYSLKEKAYRAMAAIFILESIRFYVSFTCTFAFAQNKLLEGSAKIVKFIARDENEHVGITTNVLKLWRSGAEGKEWQDISVRNEPVLRSMFQDAIYQEKDWSKYLFRDGSLLGLNDNMLCGSIDFWGNKRMKNAGLDPLNDVRENSLTWMDEWIGNSRGVQNAPQETEIESYVVGGTNRDVNMSKLKMAL